MLASSILAVLGFAATITASPLEKRKNAICAEDLIKIAPDTASCAGATFPDECATAEDAAKYISYSFLDFKITTFGTQAALVAIMLFESGDFKYSKNHFPAPGTPGQGTRNMQSPAFNLKYATWLATACSNCGFTIDDVNAAEAKGPDAVLALVNKNPEWSFSSAAWFLTTQCDHSIRDGLASGSEAGWQAYIEQCVGTTLTEDRTAGWKNVTALGHW